VLKKLSIGLALIAVGFLAGSLLVGSTGTAELGWEMGDLTDVACRLGVQPTTSGQYKVADILKELVDNDGVGPCNPPPPPCAACVAKLNATTYADFDAIYMIGPARASALIAAKPYVVANCVDATSIETVLRAVPGIENLSVSIVKALCPELYK